MGSTTRAMVAEAADRHSRSADTLLYFRYVYPGGHPMGGQSPSGLQLTMVQRAVWKPP